MKNFLQQVAAVIVGLMVMAAFTGFMSLVMLFAMIASQNTKPAISDGAVLHLNLSGTLAERAEDNPLNMFLGNTAAGTQGLDEMLAAVKEAKTNGKIAGIYIEGGILSADFASLQELRKAIVDFKKSGKFVVAYGDMFTQGSYYVASAADEVMVNPSGMIDWKGLASQPIFYKDLLEKVGVKMQTFRVGTYKSFVEPFTLTKMSDANRLQVSSFISDIWGNICKDVSASRKISTANLNSIADKYVTLADAADYVKLKLADKTAYVDQVRDKLRTLAGTKKLDLVEAHELAAVAEPKSGDGEVAVYYAYGDIVGSAEEGALSSTSQIVGPKVVEDLDALMQDDNVKAVVIRINSGGGSAFASEQIWRAVQLLKKKKPVVVSMGGMAASGGYYMACGADYIMAEPTTLTGSIGIFGMVPDASGLLTEKLGLHFDVVKTNEASDFGAMGRGFNPAESAAMQAYVERGYALFLRRVAAGRGMKTANVDSIAQGRVWTGAQALKIKLVDRLGTLDDAVAEAARRAHLDKYAVSAYPAKTEWIDELVSSFRTNYMESHLREALGQYYEPLRFAATLRGTDCLQARIPFNPNIN